MAHESINAADYTLNESHLLQEAKKKGKKRKKSSALPHACPSSWYQVQLYLLEPRANMARVYVTNRRVLGAVAPSSVMWRLKTLF